LKWTEFGSTDELYAEAEQDEKQAKEEQYAWEQGDPSPIVRDFFNHAVHIEEHNRWRKSRKYEESALQKDIDLHVDMHKQYMQQAAVEQAMAQGAPGNGPPQPPPFPGGPQTEFGTPHNFKNMAKKLGSGEPVGNSMQGRGATP
jgi:hypothetical protein